MYVSE